ncbi:MAG: peptidylprolyl isomerase [Phycisphaerales bacterium]
MSLMPLGRFGASRSRRSVEDAPCCEPLDARILLDSAPLPSITDLNNPNNTVVRFETNYGDIDIELFDSLAPITVTNFIKYVRDGDYDRTFFHRLDDDFVLQGGLARLNPGSNGAFGVKDIPVDAPIQNEPDSTNRSNLARTISMARVGGQVNSATSQFFFNLVNNTFLDTVDQGFTVFGRVVNDRSWDVLQSINDLNTRDFGTPYGELPVGSGFNQSDGVSESELVMIWDAEIIKPQGVAAFYQFKYFFPEGFAGATINEFLPIGNPNATTVNYQVIVRAEVAQPQPAPAPGNAPDPDFWYRDKVIQTGTIGANRRGGITISQSSTTTNLVERGVPYAIEVWSTSRLNPSFSHYDFGSATGEAFTTDTNTTWGIPQIQKGQHINDFLVWSNVSDTDADITVTFYLPSGGTFVFNASTQAFRRGGLAINDIPQRPDGEFSAVITSTQPLVASLTHFFNNGGSAADDTRGYSALGIPGPGLRTGIIPLASVGTDASTSEFISILNPASSVAIVTLILTFSDGSPQITVSPAGLILSPGRRATYNLADIGNLAGKSFSVRYSAGTVAVYAQSTHRENGDETAAPYAVTAAARHEYGEGFLDDARAGVDLFERFAVYNPNITALGATEQEANVTFRFLYTDGFVQTFDFVVLAGARLDFVVHTNSTLLAQARDNGRYFFTVEIVSDAPVVAMMNHYDLTLGNAQPSGGFSTIGTQRNTVSLTSLT